MKNFSNINNESLKQDFIYSEITALMIMNPNFFDFLNYEKNRYIMNDLVFKNDFLFEIRKHNILVNKDYSTIFPISIENDWRFLKECFETSKFFEKPSSIFLSKRKLILDDKIFRDKYMTDMITNLDLQKLLNLDNINLDSFVLDYINIINEHIKPEFKIILNYFITILKEMNQTINFKTFKEFKVQGLGYRCEILPKLYYNSLNDFCLDVLLYENCFRDYSLMKERLNELKLIFLKGNIIPVLNNNNLINFLIKYFSLDDNDYYYLNDKSIEKIPSKATFSIELKPIVIKYNTNKDLIVYMNDYKFNISILNCELIYSMVE